jgi:hypothetical protein
MDRFVAASELVTGVRIALGTLPVSACASLDRDRNDAIGVDELTIAVRNGLYGCQ